VRTIEPNATDGSEESFIVRQMPKGLGREIQMPALQYRDNPREGSKASSQDLKLRFVCS